MKITDDLYAYEWTNPYDNNCNSYFIGGSVGALIDPGLKRYLPDLLAAMSEDGIDRGSIRYVINTHSHPDHYEGSEPFSGSDVQIGLHRKELDFLSDIGARMFEWFGLPFPKVDVNLVLTEGEVLLGDEKFEVYLVPGHSPGSLALYSPVRKVLFPGDVVFSQNVGRSDFPGGDSDLLKQSIRRLAKLDVETLLPGHMGFVDGKMNVEQNFKLIIEHVFPFI